MPLNEGLRRRAEVADLADILALDPGSFPSGRSSAEDLQRASKVLSAGYRKVRYPNPLTTLEALENLSDASVILTPHGNVLEKQDGAWYFPGAEEIADPTDSWFPATVVWTPEEG